MLAWSLKACNECSRGSKRKFSVNTRYVIPAYPQCPVTTNVKRSSTDSGSSRIWLSRYVDQLLSPYCFFSPCFGRLLIWHLRYVTSKYPFAVHWCMISGCFLQTRVQEQEAADLELQVCHRGVFFHNSVADDANSGNSKHKLLTSIAQYVTWILSFHCPIKDPPWGNSKQKLVTRYGSQVSVMS
jgi:hypothetical protein